MTADQAAHDGLWLLPTWQVQSRLGTTQTFLERVVLLLGSRGYCFLLQATVRRSHRAAGGEESVRRR